MSGWDIAIAAIKAGGDNKNYVITLTGDIALDGDSAPTFGSVTGVTVSLRGEKTLSLDPVGTTGNLLRTGAGQTLILRSPLEGRGDNNASLVAVNGGILFMRAGSKIQNNTTTTGTTGGGVYVDSYGYGSSSFTMEDGVISGNTATNGGGVSVSGSGSSFTMKNGVISGNTGGGVSVSGIFTIEGGVPVSGSFTMEGGEISGNTGRGVSVSGGFSSFIMKDGIISGNTAASGGGESVDGGGVSVGAGVFTMEGGTISGNTAFFGGGVRVSYGSFTMKGGTISGNTATSWGGGGVYVNHGSFTMEYGEISGNTAAFGGGVSVDGGVSVGDTGSFSKIGGIIYGDSPTNTTHTPGSASNTATSGSNPGENGHAVFYYKSGNYFYRNNTLNAGDNPNTATDTFPTGTGQTSGYWTKHVASVPLPPWRSRPRGRRVLLP